MSIRQSFVRIGGELGRGLLDLLFPPQCIGCRRPGTWLCADCVSSLPYITTSTCRRCGVPISEGPLCERCHRNPPRLDRIGSVFLFEGPIRRAVHRLKYRNARALANPLGASMADWWREHPIEADAIVPVPLHADRLRQRGYNQAALLARELERRTGLPLREDILIRVRSTRPQMELDAEARQRNMVGAFSCPNGQAKGQSILLIDDVCTTGATLEACADALRAGGASAVSALTLARAP